MSSMKANNSPGLFPIKGQGFMLLKVYCFSVFVFLCVCVCVCLCEKGRGGQNRFDNTFRHKFLVHPAGVIDNDIL